MSHDNGMLAHIWAHQAKARAKSSNGNFSFEGDTLYSYWTPIAKLVDDAHGDRVALVTDQSFSVTTTGKHMPALWRALEYGRFIPAYRVPSIGATGERLSGSTAVDHAANLDALTEAYRAAVRRFTRSAKAGAWDLHGYLAGIADKATEYAAHFGLTAPSLDVAADVAAIRAAREARNTPEATTRREKAAAKREALRVERERDALAAWLAGDGNGVSRTPKGGAYLRARRGLLETSLGASVPLDHAVRAFRFVKLCRDRGEAWDRNGHTLRVGHFQVDHIGANGDFRAGCHFIEWTECERLALALGVFDQPATADGLEPTHKAA